MATPPIFQACHAGSIPVARSFYFLVSELFRFTVLVTCCLVLSIGLQEGGRSANTIRQAKVVLGAMFGMAVTDGYLDYNPFHDVKIPKVPGRRSIKVVTRSST
jgi:hypothetical protein